MFAPLRRAAEHRRAPWWVGLAATLLILPSVTAGRAVDDYLHALILDGSTAFPGFVRHPLDLFRFAGPTHNLAAMQDGILPWWADLEVRFAFFRPLSVLTHALDHALWPDSAVLMHAHNVLWHVLTLAGVWVVYREIASARSVAVLAFALYALDDARGAPVAWIANRNALVGLAVSLWALVLYHRWRAGRSKHGAWLGPLVFAVALLAGEGAVSILAYLAAYALFLDDGPLPRRLARLGPYLILLGAWAALSRALGYGVARSGVYFDPVGDPVLFLQHLPERMLVLLFAQLGGPWSEGWNAYSFTFPAAIPLVVGGGILTLAVTGFVLWPLLVRQATTRFWLTGAVLAVVPACAAFPADRLLPWVGLGVMGTLGELFAACVGSREAFWPDAVRRRLAIAMAWGIVGLHLIAAPLLLPARSRGIADVSATLGRAFDTAPATLDVTDKTFVYINPPADPFVSFMPFTREVLGIPRPKTQRWLATGLTDVTVERLDTYSVRVTPDRGYLLTDSEKLLRSPRHPFRPGDHVRLSDVDIEITRTTDDGRPAEAVFRFTRPLEDPSFIWLAWGPTGYEAFPVPGPGQRVRVPAANMLRVILGPDDPLVKALEG
jgi:hypothetical protein